MNLNQIYSLAIEMGKEVDIRGKDKDIDYFPDSKIINYRGIEIKSVYIGIDIGVGELLLIDRLKDKGYGIDAVISHHPMAEAGYRMAEVADIQKHNWIKYGVDKKSAENLIKKIKWESLMETREKNLLRAENAAEYLDIPLFCIHTAIDNLTQKYFEDLLAKNKGKKLQDLFKIISNIKECKLADKKGDGPFLLDNELKNNYVNNFLVDMTGGLDPPSEIFYYLKEKMVDTIIGMHYSLDNIKEIKDNKIAGIITGHMASDSIGLNIYCDKLESKGIKIYPGSGFYRVRR